MATDRATPARSRFRAAAAAQVAGCAYLLTEDLQDDLVLGTVRVVKPFRVSPEALTGR